MSWKLEACLQAGTGDLSPLTGRVSDSYGSLSVTGKEQGEIHLPPCLEHFEQAKPAVFQEKLLTFFFSFFFFHLFFLLNNYFPFIFYMSTSYCLFISI